MSTLYGGTLRGTGGMGWPQWLDDLRAGAADGGWLPIFTRPDGVAPPVYRAEELCTPGATPEQWAKCKADAEASRRNLAAWRDNSWLHRLARSPLTWLGISLVALLLLRWMRIL